MFIKVLFFFLIGVLSLNFTAAWTSTRLRYVHNIYLFKDRLTAGDKPIQQLNCFGDSVLCNLYAPYSVTCQNLNYLKYREAVWKCTATLANDIAFDALDVQCQKDRTSIFDDAIIDDSCGLRYSLRRVSSTERIVGTVFAVIFGIVILVVILIVCAKVCQGCESTGYTTHSPTVISPRPVNHTTVYSIPVAPAPAYYNPGYTTTHVSSGYSGTSFRNDNYTPNYSSGNDYSSKTETGYAGTSFR